MLRASAVALVLGFAALSASASPASGGQRKKPSVIEAALQEAFPGAQIERVTCVLDGPARKKVGDLAAQEDFPKKTTFAYVAKKKGKVVGTAFFDSHVVRTKRETLMVVVTPKGELEKVVTLAFQEPPEYMARKSFYDSLKGRVQGRELTLGRGLDGTTGATLTCEAVSEAARRVLGLHEVLGVKAGRAKPAAKEGKGKKLEPPQLVQPLAQNAPVGGADQ